MTNRPTDVADSEEVWLLRREVEALRQRVAELEHGAAGDASDESGVPSSSVDVSAWARRQLLLESERIAHVGSWVWDVSSDKIFWSDELCRLLGYDAATLATRDKFYDRVHPEDIDRVRSETEHALQQGFSQPIELRLRLPDGAVRFVIMNATMLFDASGAVTRVVGTVQDLTESRTADQTLRRTLEQLEQAQDIAQLGSYSFDPASGRIEWSAGACRVLGYPLGVSANADSYFERVHPDDRERVAALHRRALAGELTPEFETRIVRPTGEVRLVRTRSIALRDGTGQVREYRGTLLDVTEHAALMQQVAHLGKMEAVGRLAAGIAHDFNNLLTVIGANLELWAEASEREGEIADARRALRSAKSLTDRLLMFGRKAPLSKVVVDPNELVARTAELVRRVIDDRISVETDLATVMPALRVDTALIEQALINLVINSRDAIVDNGRVILRTRARETDAGVWVELEVEDDGPGMSPDVKEKIFEPFFTTKGALGTGLGLATVLGTIEQHGGNVEVVSELGGGARFRLRLPAEPSAQAEPRAPEPRRSEIDAVERQVLVVEDEPLVATVISRTLERKGIRVVLAHHPADALRLWADHPQLSLVICDVSMAGMRGPELVKRLRQTGRRLRVLYVTGYSEEAARDTLGERVLTKPFAPRELLRAMNELA
jgi:PAS domain S-box-containing protein